MATKILMPKLSDTMEEGVLLKWLKKEGEPVKQGEIWAEIQSDKADMELEAYDSGILRKIFIHAGEKGAIGAPLAIIAGKDEDISALLGDAKAPVAPAPKVLIPGGTYIDEKRTIREVARLRFAQPKDRVEQAVRHLSEMVPLKYRLLAAAAFYLFWVLLFFAFFRVFTWARYTTVLAASFFCGALVYFFMPDFVAGRWDDVGFLAWSLTAGGALFWYRRRQGKPIHFVLPQSPPPQPPPWSGSPPAEP